MWSGLLCLEPRSVASTRSPRAVASRRAREGTLCIGIGHDLLRLHERVCAYDVNGNPFAPRIDQKHAHRGLLSRRSAEPAGINALGRGDTDDEIACFVGAQHPNRRDMDPEPRKVHGDPSRRPRNRQPNRSTNRGVTGQPLRQWPGENIET